MLRVRSIGDRKADRRVEYCRGLTDLDTQSSGIGYTYRKQYDCWHSIYFLSSHYFLINHKS